MERERPTFMAAEVLRETPHERGRQSHIKGADRSPNNKVWSHDVTRGNKTGQRNRYIAVSAARRELQILGDTTPHQHLHESHQTRSIYKPHAYFSALRKISTQNGDLNYKTKQKNIGCRRRFEHRHAIHPFLALSLSIIFLVR